MNFSSNFKENGQQNELFVLQIIYILNPCDVTETQSAETRTIIFLNLGKSYKFNGNDRIPLSPITKCKQTIND